MDILTNLLPIIQSGGIPVVLFIIWYFTFTRSNKQMDDAIKYADKRFTESSEEARRLFNLALSETRAKSDDAIKYANDLFREASVRQEKLLADANARHEKSLNELISLQKEEVRAKELLVGLLSSMKTQLETNK